MIPERPSESNPYELLLNTPEYQQTVARIARRQTRDTSISWEDAAQTAHEKVLNATRSGKFGNGGVKEFYHWAARVAKNAIVDLVRKHKRQNWQSLDQNIPGTDLSLLDTIADDFDLPDAIEFKDLLLRTIEAVRQLERDYPNRRYLKLWDGLKQGKNQSQLAAELGVTQGAISRRRKELCQRIAQTLGLFEAETIKQQINPDKRITNRNRSNTEW